MKVRADVAELLRAGHSDRAIARQLNTGAKTVAEARAVLRLPKHPSGKRAAASREELFWRRTQATDDGHLKWTGTRSNGVPTLRYGGRQHTACRIAFTIRYGREPVGQVTRTCDIDGCVHPNCVVDRTIREANQRADATFDAVFGGAL
ncbi:hypothetical protein [Streptomyces sp. NPDC054940]